MKIKLIVLLISILVLSTAISFTSKSQNIHTIYFPAVFNTAPSAPAILTYDHEYEFVDQYNLKVYPEKNAIQIAGSVFKWNNQDWPQYALWYRKEGSMGPWCNLFRNDEGRSIWYGAKLGPDFCYDTQPGGPLTEFLLADGLPGNETTRSASIFVDLKTVSGTVVVNPPFTLSVETYPLEKSGTILLRWTGTTAVTYSARYSINGGDPVMQPIGIWWDRSKLLEGFTPGDQVEITAFSESNPSNTVTITVK